MTSLETSEMGGLVGREEGAGEGGLGEPRSLGWRWDTEESGPTTCHLGDACVESLAGSTCAVLDAACPHRLPL